ncbi:MAG: ComEC/Rec2 family competence protein, partial [Allomuricauda sp.]
RKENNNSLILLITHGAFNFLLCGDAERNVWEDERIKAKINQLERVHVLKVSHHGAENGSLNSKKDLILPELARKTQFAVVCSHIWRYGHPSKAVLEQLKMHKTEVLRTEVNQNQNIEFVSDGKELIVKYFQEA